MNFWHGLVDYKQGLSIQDEARARVEKSGAYEMHGFEFHPVITLGRRASEQHDVLANSPHYKKFQICHVERGGEATLHNPGQLVIYPVVNLRIMNLGVREFVEHLQSTTVELLKAYGVNAALLVGCPGVYTAKGKIGFVGVRIQRGISTHGVSLNVRNNLDDFQSIRSCGVLRPKLDRLSSWNVDASNKELHTQWSDLFLQRLLLDQKPNAGLSHGPLDLRS